MRSDQVTCQAANPPSPAIGMRNPSSVSSINEHLSTLLQQVHSSSRLPVTIGGDHSLAVATLTATLTHHPEAGILWIDAHADINSPSTTPSGNLHGCPVAFLLGLEGTNVPPFNGWVKPLLKPERIAYIGLRDLDSGERKVLKQLGIKCYTMHHVDRYGIGHVLEEALSYLGAPEKPIHLSFDVDALDPSVAPSTGTPVRGGLTFREGHYICERVWETGSLVAMDLVEVNPDLGAKREEDAKATVAVGCSLIRSALGEVLL